MADLAKVKRNIGSMIEQGAPEADIDAYIATEGVTLDQLNPSASASSPTTNLEPAQGAAPPAPSQTQPRGSQETYKAMEAFVRAKFPKARITSDYRTPEQNKKVHGVEGSYHTTKQAFDVVDLSAEEREQLRKDLQEAGVNPREFLFHNAGSGYHLHVAADQLPEQFLQQWGGGDATGGLGFNDEQKSLVLNYIPHAKDAADLEQFARTISSGAVGIENAKQLLDYYQSTKTVPSTFRVNPEKPTEAPAADPEGFDWGHLADYVSNQVGRAPGDILGMVGDAVVEPFRDLGDIPQKAREFVHGASGELDDQDKAAIQERATRQGLVSGALDKLYSNVVGTEEPLNAAERYTGATARGAAGSAFVPGASARLLLAGAGAGAGGQAGQDLFPNSPVAPLVGSLLGGAVAGGAPSLPKARSEMLSSLKAGKLARDPRAPFMAEVAQDLVRMGDEHAPNGVMPKGRGPVTVQQIGSLERSYLVGFKEKLNKLDLDEATKRKLKDAIENRYSISPEDLTALTGTPEGNAVALGIQKIQVLRDMTPPYGGNGLGPAKKLWNFALDWVPIPGLPSKVPQLLKARSGDVNASRLDAGRKVVAARRAYEKLGQRVGPSGQREAQQAFNQKYADTVSAQEAEAAAPKPKGPKRSANDLGIQVNMAQGLKGSWGSTDGYARILGVNREDLLGALDRVDLQHVDPFQVEKLRNGFNVDRSVQGVLIPRLQKLLQDNGTIAKRAEEAKAAQARKAAAAKPAEAPQPAKPTTTNFDAPPPEPAQASSSGDYRRVARPAQHELGKQRIVAAQERRRDDMFHEDSPLSQEILRDTNEDVNHVIHTARTAEDAMHYWDNEVVPRLQKEGEFLPSEIKDLRPFIERIANEKRYKTQAEFEKGTKVGARGRPKKQPEPTLTGDDDVPF